jgi:hypothetical protein
MASCLNPKPQARGRNQVTGKYYSLHNRDSKQDPGIILVKAFILAGYII